MTDQGQNMIDMIWKQMWDSSLNIKRDDGSTAFYFWKFIPTLVEGE